MNYSTIALSDRKKQLVPSTLTLLNPQRERKARHLYFVWLVDPENPCSLDDATKGKSFGFYGFFSDLDNFDKIGQNNPLATTKKEWDLAVSEYKSLLNAVLDRRVDIVTPGGEWAFLWCLCDCTGGEVGIGSSPVFSQASRASKVTNHG